MRLYHSGDAGLLGSMTAAHTTIVLHNPTKQRKIKYVHKIPGKTTIMDLWITWSIGVIFQKKHQEMTNTFSFLKIELLIASLQVG